jgi:phosphate-selective porin OprO/OprP
MSYAVHVFYDEGTLTLDLWYNDANEQGNAFKPYRQIASIWHQGRKGRFALGVDFTTGRGEFNGAPDVYGLTLIPSYDIANNLLLGGDRLQFATRYQYAASDGNNGLQVQPRYEGEVTSGEGDRYEAYYVGLNYLIYGDRLKLMAGAEFAELRDRANDGGRYRGWTYLAGLRLYF